jgi:signal transduction histidine kinase
MTGPIRCLGAVLVVMGVSGTIAPKDGPHTSIAVINSRPETPTSTVTVRATLTLNGDPAYIQDATGGAAVEGLSAQDLRIGDELLITGQADDTETGLVFRKASVQLLWHGSPMPPLSVTADEAALGKFAALLIEVTGRLDHTERSNGATWLWLENGHQVFLAHLNAERGNPLLPRIGNGSVLRLRGVCSLQPRDTRYQGGFAILLRSAEDVAVVSGPPWWSLRHLVELVILLGCLVIGGHLTLVQMLKLRFRAIMAERARTAHELHDTLTQSLAGLSYQIQAARKNAPATNQLLIRHLDLALGMVRHSHSEAHRSIMMLRPQPWTEDADLRSAIQASLEQSVGCHLEVRFTTKGSVTPLPLMTTDTLYRVAQEAIANALCHGHPSVLAVNLEYTPRSVCLSVVDNGVGFETKTSLGRGLGLAGMRERVRALHGDFSVTSEPGSGTRVRAELYVGHSAGARFASAFHLWWAHSPGPL